MFKLQFARCSEPSEPSWNASGDSNPFAARSDNPALADCWDWLSGSPGATATGSSTAAVSDLIQGLDANTEVERIAAADEKGEGQASKDSRQSFRSCCSQAADLKL